MPQARACPIPYRSAALAGWRWGDDDGDGGAGGAKGVVVVMHGLFGHGRFVTVAEAALLFSARGYVVYSFDQHGHGESGGPRGVVPSPNAWVEAGTAVLAYARAQHPGLAAATFAVGASMGGSTAIRCAARLQDTEAPLAGIVVLAPLLELSADKLPPAWQVSALRALACLAPNFAALGAGDLSNEKQYADPVLRARADDDALSYRGKIPLATGASALDTAALTRDDAAVLRTPVLLLQGTMDVVVDPTAAARVWPSIPSEDKEYVEVPGALHALLCEGEANRAVVVGKMTEWVDRRRGGSSS